MELRKSLLPIDIIETYSVDRFCETTKVRQTLKIFDIATKWDQLVTLVRIWRQRRRERQDLASLPAHLLKDIGVSPAEAQVEIAKPFWRA